MEHQVEEEPANFQQSETYGNHQDAGGKKMKPSKRIRSRTTAAVKKIQTRSFITGVSRLSLKEINAEILSTRKKHKASQVNAVKALVKLKGKLNWEGNLNTMRKNRG